MSRFNYTRFLICRVLIFLVVVVVVYQSCSIAKSHLENHTDEYISNTLNSLEKLANFYARNIDKVNLDSVFGIRIAQGSLSKLVKDMHPNSIESNSEQLFSRIKKIWMSLKKAADNAEPLLKKYQPDYYMRFKPIVNKAWQYFKDFDGTRFPTLLPVPLDSNNFERDRNGVINEKVSDKCMTEIMGTASGQRNPCYVSKECANLMTSPKQRNYGNTHQILYFVLGFQQGCRGILKEMVKKSLHLAQNGISDINSFLKKKCEQIFTEMNELERTVHFTFSNKDLYMEQGLVCSILGFRDFLNHKILRDIFSWQDSEHGCFGKENQNESGHDDEISFTRGTMRKLLNDRTLPNGCSSHETGVATGLLSIYLRWLITYSPRK